METFEQAQRDVRLDAQEIARLPYQNREPELGKDELEGFENYVNHHYVEALERAIEITNLYYQRNNISTLGPRTQASNPIALATFEKIATPRVFLIQMWRDLTDDQRLSYYSKDYQDKAKAEAEAISKKASKTLSQ